MHKLLLFTLLAVTFTNLPAQPKTNKQLQTILAANTNAAFQKVLQKPNDYRLQIIYTQINRNQQNQPTFKNYYFNYDPNLYFNPASMVKMPLAFLSLEKLNNMKVQGVNKFTAMQFDSSFAGQTTAFSDSTSETGLPSIAHYIKKAFLISDNDAYNRMYQFVGQQTIHRSLHQKGYKDARIVRQFMGFSKEQNRRTNQIRFVNKDGSLIYTQPPAYNTDSFDFSRKILVGNAHYNRNDELIQQPFDFTEQNNLTLYDPQQMLQSVLFPASVPASKRFNLTRDDLQFLYQTMSQYPSETNYPKYDTAVYYDSYVKFFFRDSTHKMPSNVRVFNKVGWSYGFLTDVSYVNDTANKIEYMLAATLYVNSDGVLNDNKYEYESVGHPFLRQLGKTIYEYELQRQRRYSPDLSRFKINYETRDKNDNRPAIKDADN